MLKYMATGVTLLMVLSCSSVESDAKKAASLINKSIELTNDLKLEKAERDYLKAQEIINKYIEKDKAVEFYEHFANYRDKEKKQSAK